MPGMLNQQFLDLSNTARPSNRRAIVRGLPLSLPEGVHHVVQGWQRIAQYRSLDSQKAVRVHSMF
jgi:hypothetical protein